ncbi:MAG TPA: hypothetical protein VHW96_12225 [Solirubrobacteraceae bacterium]|nr:hypothetical protein [Solirubrobacteraceae bacterium]
MRRAGGRSIVNGLIFAALAAEFIALAGHVLFGWGSKSYPPTPPALVFRSPVPPSGADVLLRLSAEAASQSSPPWPAGAPYAYVKITSWSLHTHNPQSKAVPSTSAAWRSRDEVPALSGSRPVLAQLLAAGRRGGGWAPGWEFADLGRLTQTRPVPGAAQAVLLRILSRIPDVVNQGSTTDRAGRAGAAVSLDSSYSGEPITYTLIFNQATGALLESDETLSDRPHRLDAVKGAVVGFTTFVRSGYVASRSATP